MPLQEIIDETIEAIRDGSRADGSTYPIQSFVAAKQVLAEHDLTSTPVQERLFREMVRMQLALRVVEDPYLLACTSLVDFIGKAAEQQMGHEYEDLKQRRFDTASSSESRYAE
jgi:hypothetical protein